MTWQLAILVNLICVTVYYLLYRRYAKEHPEQSFVAAFLIDLFVLVPVGVAWVFIIGGPSFEGVGNYWWQFLITGALLAIGNVSMFKASTKVEASQIVTINTLRTVVIVIASGVLLSEHLTAWQALGALLALSASFIVVSANSRHVERHEFTIYSMIAIFSAICIGLAVTTEKFLIESVGLATYILISWPLQTFLIMTFAGGKRLKQAKPIFKSGSYKQLLVIGVFRTVSAIGFVSALQMAHSASLVASVASVSVITVALGGYIFLGERTNGVYKLAAAAVAFIGVMLLIR